MRLAIDLDGVVFDFDAGWRRIYNHWFDDTIAERSATWDATVLDTVFDTEKQFYTWCDHADVWGQLQMLPGAPAAIDKLVLEHDVTFLTSRHANSDASWHAEDWHINSPWADVSKLKTGAGRKAKFADDFDLFIDDSPKQMRAFSENSVPFVTVRWDYNANTPERSWRPFMWSLGAVARGYSLEAARSFCLQHYAERAAQDVSS